MALRHDTKDSCNTTVRFFLPVSFLFEFFGGSHLSRIFALIFWLVFVLVFFVWFHGFMIFFRFFFKQVIKMSLFYRLEVFFTIHSKVLMPFQETDIYLSPLFFGNVIVAKLI